MVKTITKLSFCLVSELYSLSFGGKKRKKKKKQSQHTHTHTPHADQNRTHTKGRKKQHDDKTQVTPKKTTTKFSHQTSSRKSLLDNDVLHIAEDGVNIVGIRGAGDMRVDVFVLLILLLEHLLNEVGRFIVT